MKKMILYGGLFVVLFGCSAAVSWIMVGSPPEEVAEGEGDPTDQIPDAVLEPLPEFKHTDDLPVVFRPDDITSESLLRMADMLKKREDALRENEKRISQEKSRLEFVFQDLQREQKELDALHDRISARLQDASALLKEIQTENQSLGEKKDATVKQLKEFEKDVAKMDENEQAKVQKLADYCQDMPEDTAANYLRETCDSGQIELAAKILDTMERRFATKILVAFNDPVLVSQLMEKIRKIPVVESASKGGKKKR